MATRNGLAALNRVIRFTVFAHMLASSSPAWAQTYVDIHSLVQLTEGIVPQSNLVLANDARMYGTASGGGPDSGGSVFRIDSNGSLVVLHTFTNAIDFEGFNPRGGVIQGSDGNFYGVNNGGYATTALGTVFKMTPAGAVTVLHKFTGTDGARPVGGLVQGRDGYLYGTTEIGGTSNVGAVFKISTDGTLTTLHSFVYADGQNPAAALVQGADDAFYGVTPSGGVGHGSIFRITSDGAFTNLHSFQMVRGGGGGPNGPLLLARNGSFYGTTLGGGIYNTGAGGDGTAFRYDTDGTYTEIHSFNNAVDGNGTKSGLIEGPDGFFYGTTYSTGGPGSDGVLYRMDPSGAVTVLHNFATATGSFPYAGVTAGPGRNLYGTTTIGGSGSVGAIYRLHVTTLGTTTDDFSGDGLSDVAVYRPSTGAWWISNSNTTTFNTYGWGLAGDVPVAADYDGDGRMDVAVFRPSTGAWWILRSGSNYTTYANIAWGTTGDVPVPADFDGDGKADIAVYRAGVWWILKSSTGYTTYSSYNWGTVSDIPVPADFDGDGKADIAVFRPSTGTWFILKSSTGYASYVAYNWGANGDVPVVGDYDGDGKADLAIFRPTTGTWFILKSSAGYAAYNAYSWGLSTDTPVVGDFDGDGRADVAVYRPTTGNWWILKSSSGFTTYSAYSWGAAGDKPIGARP